MAKEVNQQSPLPPVSFGLRSRPKGVLRTVYVAACNGEGRAKIWAAVTLSLGTVSALEAAPAAGTQTTSVQGAESTNARVAASSAAGATKEQAAIDAARPSAGEDEGQASVFTVLAPHIEETLAVGSTEDFLELRTSAGQMTAPEG